MASKGSSKRSASRDDGDIAAEPAVKRARTSSSPTTALASLAIEDSESEAELSFEDEIRQRVQSIIDTGGAAGFAQYAQPIVDLPDDDEDASSHLSELSFLMQYHDTSGDFWSGAWPIAVYITYDTFDTTFDTPLSSEYIDQNAAALLQGRDGTRRNWFHALQSFRNAGAAKEDIVQFADHYKVAMDIAVLGYQTAPVLYNASQQHVDYVADLQMLVDRAQLREPWLHAMEELRAAFGDAARDELQQVFDGFNVAQVEAEGEIGVFPSHESIEQEIFCKYLSQTVERQPALTITWFRGELDYIRECSAIFARYIRIADLQACAAYAIAPDQSKYIDMCTELERYINTLRQACLQACKNDWKPYITSGATRARRAQLYNSFVDMKCHFEAGGLPYLSAEAELRDSMKHGMRDTDAKARLDAEFELVWNIALAKAANLGQAAERVLLLTQKQEGKSANPPYGPDFAAKFRAWDGLIAALDSSVVSTSTHFRYRDVYDRVLKFKTQFGVFIDCKPGLEMGLSDQNCEILVNTVESCMNDIDFLVWNTWANFTCIDDDDTSESNRLASRRGILRASGYYWPPHETEPVPLKPAVQADQLGFGSDRSDLNGMWTFQGTLGGGSWGHAGVWEQQGAASGIKHRIVVKESYQQATFGNPQYWQGELYRRVVKEYSIGKYLSELPNSQNIIKPHAVALYETLKMYRIYMDYLPYGDLEDTIKQHMRDDVPIPERQMLAIFEAVMNALCLMKYGALPGTPPNNRHGASILHRDIKPCNIFLGDPDDTNWPSIPVAVLGDFGLVTRHGDPGSNQFGVGTMDYAAPEQQVNAPRDEVLNPSGVCPASDLWGVGKSMLHLMNLEHILNIKPFRFGEPVSRFAIEFNRTGLSYSQPLRALVQRCLTEAVTARPTAEQVWRDIQGIITAQPNPWKTRIPPTNERIHMREKTLIRLT